MDDEESLRDEYEYYDEWLNRDPELSRMSLDEYNESRCIEDYGSTNEDLTCGDEDE